MIHGVGIDIVEINRIEQLYIKYKERCFQRLLHTTEFVYIPTQSIAIFLASRFAVKEAFVKALGTGFINGIAYKDIALTKDSLNKPILQVYNKAEVYYRACKIQYAHVSISHEKSYTVATVILEL